MTIAILSAEDYNCKDFFCTTTFWKETEWKVRSWGLGTSCVHFLTTFSDMFSVIFIFPPLLQIYHCSSSKFPFTEANFPSLACFSHFHLSTSPSDLSLLSIKISYHRSQLSQTCFSHFHLSTSPSNLLSISFTIPFYRFAP